MGKIKSRSGARATRPAQARTKRTSKRPRGKRARAAAPAASAHHAQPPRAAHAVHSRTAVAAAEPAGVAPGAPPFAPFAPQNLPSFAASAAPAALSLVRNLSRPLWRQIARQRREWAIAATRQLALMRLAVRRTQRQGARAWEYRVDQLQALQRDLRRRRLDWELSGRRWLRRGMAAAVDSVADVWRGTQAGTLRRLHDAHVSLARAVDGRLEAAGLVLARATARVLRPVWPLWPYRRQILGGTLAALAVAAVAAAWLAVYSSVTPAPTPEPRIVVAPVAPVASPKAFTERFVTPPLGHIAEPGAAAPAALAAEASAQAAPPQASPTPPVPVVVLPQVEPLPDKRQATRGKTEHKKTERKAARHKRQRREPE